jgi:hypothetical protein
MIKVRGQQGQWWVDAGSYGRLPTAHSCYAKRSPDSDGLRYRYDHRALGGGSVPGWTRKYESLLGLLAERKMVVLCDDREGPGNPLPKLTLGALSWRTLRGTP